MLVRFEMYFTAEESGIPRERWNGGRQASYQASKALVAAVEAARAELIRHGFEPNRVGYGVLPA